MRVRDSGMPDEATWDGFFDPDTPRGPDMSFRPRAEECIATAEQSGFAMVGGLVDLPPYHWGAMLASTRRPMSRR